MGKDLDNIVVVDLNPSNMSEKYIEREDFVTVFDICSFLVGTYGEAMSLNGQHFADCNLPIVTSCACKCGETLGAWNAYLTVGGTFCSWGHCDQKYLIPNNEEKLKLIISEFDLKYAPDSENNESDGEFVDEGSNI